MSVCAGFQDISHSILNRNVHYTIGYKDFPDSHGQTVNSRFHTALDLKFSIILITRSMADNDV